MTVEIVYEAHATTTDNEAGIATGWSDTSLSDLGRRQATELGERNHGVDAIFCSDLFRAVETATIAFPDRDFTPDHRLRECDYGEMTRAPSKAIAEEWTNRVVMPFPGGESLRDVAARMRSLLDDIARDHDGQKVLLIAHRGPKLALDHLLGGMALEDAAAVDYPWEPGWRYTL